MKWYKPSILLAVIGFFVYWNTSHGYKLPSAESTHLPNATSENLIPLEPTTTKDSQAEFRDRLEQVLSEVPTIQSLDQYSDEDLHFGIPGLAKLGEDVGHIIDKMESHPEWVPNGLIFFRRCALNPNVVLSVRAVCLRNYLDWTKGKEAQNEFPQEVKDLAQKLPGGR